jgi:deoxyribodipyrimidine photo-lyase
VNQKRIKIIREGKEGFGPVVYWMSRDQRVRDNWALIHAQELALERKAPLLVVFCLAKQFLGATWRQYSFMLGGLREVEKDLARRHMGFIVAAGEPSIQIPRLAKEADARLLVTDFDPLRLKRQWLDAAARRLRIPLNQVDAHNIIPCWVASPKREFGAHTLRPKLQRQLPEFLKEFPRLHTHPFRMEMASPKVDWDRLVAGLSIDRAVGPVDWARPGEKAAGSALDDFLKRRLAIYADSRNNPVVDGQSHLSPWLHFGHLSAQRIALEAQDYDENLRSQEAFLEELVVRRELSDNFCYYAQDYDSCEAFPDWARATLEQHRSDVRPYLYSFSEFEAGQTHDELWNAAQLQMVRTGRMHGYLRMYWAKKILEWTESPEEAMHTAIDLNDRYELDGRDPNGYAGIAWSIGGVHDRAWGERPVFGKIRYMSYNGARRKFDTAAYIAKFKGLSGARGKRFMT